MKRSTQQMSASNKDNVSNNYGSNNSNGNAGHNSNAKKPKFAFAIDTTKISSIPTNTDPNTIHKLFWSKFCPNKTTANSISTTDWKSFNNLLQLEKSLIPKSFRYMRDMSSGAVVTNYASDDIEPWMRQKCFEWLLEVSESREADPNVVFHAMALFDQMLILKVIPNDSLQLVAATGYLLASKLRETCPVTPSELQTFTYNAFSESDIKQFEMCMAVCLEWELDCVTPCQFLQPMASFLVCTDIVGTMVESSVGVLQKCVASEQLCGVRASLLAASGLLYTMACLAVSAQAQNVFNLCSHRLMEFTGESMENIINIVNRIEESLTSQSQSSAITSSVHNNNNNSVTNDYREANPTQSSNVTPPKSGSNNDEESEQTTPLGVQDVIQLL
ncbi:uncharacterized protein LOC142337725 [Convolutriloba macropyga]|uniref:uncharacterized protein LOC142337725 n=1 Tax=Convolutriloba macropyga TaxID=536237 RepID=UPI003F52639F